MKQKIKITVSVILIIVAVFLAFSNCFRNGFVNWDDNRYVIDNPLIRGITGENINRMVTERYLNNYQPLTLLSYALNYRFCKLEPQGYHLTNVVFHLLNCLLLFWVVFLLSRNAFVALVTALLFGIHPLRVESVAWASGRKDVLCAFFYLGALVSWLYHRESRQGLTAYFLALLFFILALLSKTIAVTLPAVLLLIDFFKGKRDLREIITQQIPFILLALVFAVIGIFAQAEAIRPGAVALLMKIRIACYGIFFYLHKTLWPVKLSSLYMYSGSPHGMVPAVYIWSPAVVAVMAAAMIFSLKFTKKAVFGGLFFLLTVFPALQFVPLGVTIVADRYTYIPSIGLSYVIAVSLAWCMTRMRGRITAAAATALLVLVFSALAYLTSLRCEVWRNDAALWNDVLANGNKETAAIAQFNRGMNYWRENDLHAAYLDFKGSLERYYKDMRVPYSEEALAASEKSEKGYLKAFNLLGTGFAEINRYWEAIVLFTGVLARDPLNVDAHLNLCVTYGKIEKFKDAVASGEQAVEIAPASAAARYNLAVAYYCNKQYLPAQKQLQTAESLGFSVPAAFKEELQAEISRLSLTQ